MFFESKMIQKFIKQKQIGSPGVMIRVFHDVTIAGFYDLRANHQQFQAGNSDLVVCNACKRLYFASAAIRQDFKIPPEVIGQHRNLKEGIVVLELAGRNRSQSFLLDFTDQVFRIGPLIVYIDIFMSFSVDPSSAVSVEI